VHFNLPLAVALALTPLASAPAQTTQPAKAAPTYVEIPIKGGFGEEVFASGVFRALNEAKSRKIKHAVFVIDSPGGVVADAVAIQKVMDQFEPDFTYHCVIVRGISASMAVVSGCRNVFMPDGGATGAAVSFSTNVDTGSAEVDAKMNAAWASQLAARADKHGQPGVLYRAMVEKPAEVWWGKDGAGKFVLAAHQGTLTETEQVDSPESVLALTVSQAVKYGFAKPVPTADAKGVGALIGVADWVPASDMGAKAMKAGVTEVNAKKGELLRAVEQFNKYNADIDTEIKRYNMLIQRDTDPAALRGCGEALQKIRNCQKSMENLAQSYPQKGRDWLKARRIDESLFKETLTVPQMTIDIETAQRNLTARIAALNSRR
jgi:hypothetical protein